MLPLKPCRSRGAGRNSARRAARGVTIVELMLGVAIGLMIAAGGVTFLSHNLREHRSLLLESRLMQDLRTVADIVTRDVRRAGYWGTAERGIWTPGAGAVLANPYMAVAPAAAASDASASGTRGTRPRTTASTRMSSSVFACAAARSRCSSEPATGKRSPTAAP